MKTAHTPGPWYEARTGNHQGLVISEATSANVAVTYDKKDAQLIAAAPDLLGALIEVMGYFSPSSRQGRKIAGYCRAAIAKATGETP
jgi:hypothetical protein